MAIVIVAVIIGLGDANPAAASPGPGFGISWSLEQYQPNIPQGGRANTIAVNPADNADIFVASESGGLFRTTDGGVSWRHVDQFAPFKMSAVAFLPGQPAAQPAVLIATATDDYSLGNSGGGIWRSADGGATWSHIPNPAAPPNAGTRFAAGEISIAPDTNKIYVSTTYGVSVSADNGKTWSSSALLGSFGALSVVALANNIVIAANGFEEARSTDGGANWTNLLPGQFGIADLHAFARSPVSSNTVYAVNGAAALFVSENGGVGWNQIATPTPAGDLCGGIGFVKPVPAPAGLTLWFSDRCSLFHQAATPLGNGRFAYNPFTESVTDHTDMRDLAFTTTKIPVPLLLGSDGGLMNTADGGATWHYTGGGAAGYNALQITDVHGQRIDSTGEYDLYFGTQDNEGWGSLDAGATWPNGKGQDAFQFQLMKHIPVVSDSQITFRTSSVTSYSVDRLKTTQNWNDPPGPWAGQPPAIVATSFHVENVSAQPGAAVPEYADGLAVTRDLSTRWSQYAVFPEMPYDLPKLSHRVVSPAPGISDSLAVQYQAVGTNGGATITPIRISQILLTPNLSPTAAVYYPAMHGFGSLGVNPTMFAQFEVFAVDPFDSMHLIAADILNGDIAVTADGGDNWTPDPNLTPLVTQSGALNFSNGMFSEASAISFYADNPNMVAAGTQQAGLMLSTDRGASWFKVPNSERATYITSVEWSSPTEAYVSTYGRGLWRLTGTAWIPSVPNLCQIVACTIAYIDLGDPAPGGFQQGVVVFDGQIRGTRAVAGRLAEIFVTPGSTIGFVGNRKAADQLRVTETAEAGGSAGTRFERMKRTHPKSNPVGIALDKKGAVRGVLFTKGALPLSSFYKPAIVPRIAVAAYAPPPPSRSPTADKPYVTLFAGPNRVGGVGPGTNLTLKGVRFAPKADIEVLVKGEVVQRAPANDNGAFDISFAAPMAFGVYSLKVRDAATKRSMGGAMFWVRPIDDENDSRKH